MSNVKIWERWFRISVYYSFCCNALFRPVPNGCPNVCVPRNSHKQEWPIFYLHLFTNISLEKRIFIFFIFFYRIHFDSRICCCFFASLEILIFICAKSIKQSSYVRKCYAISRCVFRLLASGGMLLKPFIWSVTVRSCIFRWVELQLSRTKHIHITIL